MKRILIALLTIGAFAAGPQPNSVSAAGIVSSCAGVKCEPAPVKTVSNGYTYAYNAAGRFFVGFPQFKVTGGLNTVYVSQSVIDCGVVAPPGAGGQPEGGDCVRAVCRVGARVGRWLIVFYRETFPNFAAAWTAGPRRCAIATPPIPLRDVDAAASEYLRKTLNPAAPVVQPGAITLVNFPTIVSTDDPGPQGFHIDLPLPGDVAVAPTFEWAFTDPTGTVATATGPGRPYDGTLPSSFGYYLTHAFTSSGTGTVSVTATWTGTVKVDGVDPVALDPLVFTRTVNLTVKENRPVLVG